MKKEQIELCRELINEYHTQTNEKDKSVIRNKIFKEMQPFLSRWIVEVLSKKGTFLSKEEILSQSWDCFEFCLRYFKPNKGIAIPNHFYAYTKFYFLVNPPYLDKDVCDTYAPDNIEQSIDSGAKLYENLDELRTFRKSLNQEDIITFDDAVMSMIPGNKYKQHRIKQSTTSHVKYKESKRAFKAIIDYLIRRG